jgi:hypothetical protein
MGRLVVVDETRHRLLVERDDGTFVPVGREGSGLGEFHYPAAVAIGDDEVYVADSWNHRVQVFGLPDWAPRRCFGSRGHGSGEFFRPSALALIERPLEEAWLVVADTNNGRLSFHALSGDILFVRTIEPPDFPVDVEYVDGAIRVKGEDGAWTKLEH